MMVLGAYCDFGDEDMVKVNGDKGSSLMVRLAIWTICGSFLLSGCAVGFYQMKQYQLYQKDTKTQKTWTEYKKEKKCTLISNFLVCFCIFSICVGIGFLGWAAKDFNKDADLFGSGTSATVSVLFTLIGGGFIGSLLVMTTSDCYNCAEALASVHDAPVLEDGATAPMSDQAPEGESVTKPSDDKLSRRRLALDDIIARLN